MDDTEAFSCALAIAAKLPKVELHLHLDGSLLPSFIRERAKARGIEVPETDRALRDFVDEMKGQLKKSHDARVNTAVEQKKNWPIFDWMNRFLQTADELHEATRSLACALRQVHNVRYAEIRFCPALHTLEGLSELEAVRAVASGFEAARAACGLRGGILLCALRSYPAPHPLETAALARDHLGRGVVGFDVAGSETFALSLPPIAEALAACSEWSVPTTVHAGELPRGMVANCRFALEQGVRRLGHGLALCFGEARDSGEESDLLRLAAAANVHVEVCLTSICTPSKCPGYAAHPIRRMVDAGLSVSLSCDNLTLSGDPEYGAAYPLHADSSYAHPSGELAHLVVDCGFSWREAAERVLDGVRAGFGSDAALVAEFEAEVDRVLREEGLL